MDGRGYLEKLIADSLGASRQGSLNRAEIRGVAIGLVAAGTLGQEEAERMLADLDVTLQRSGRLKNIHAEGSARGGFTTAVTARAGTERPEWRQAIEAPPAPRLRQVVSLVGRTLTAGEVKGELVSLEVWSTMLVLNLAHVDVEPRRVRERFGAQWHGWDDVGTQYRGGRGGGSGSHALYTERRVFEPGPPEEARVVTLVLESGDDRATVAIELAAN